MKNHNRDQHEREVIANAKKGSEEALAELLESQRDWLISLAEKSIDSWLRPGLAASDVVQGSIIQATAKFNSFRGTTEQEFRAWLHRLFSNHLIDRQCALLAQKRNVQLELTLNEEGASEECTPSEIAAAREEAGRVLDAISCLDDELRTIVQLRYLHEKSFEEIANHAGISRFAAQRRWAKAIELLAAKLKNQD